MANESRHIKSHIKKKLITESGNKCANPSCSNIRPEIHYIKQWYGYHKTYDRCLSRMPRRMP
ncbi:hypothetical protein FX983_02726 [Pseudomonas frederiksbergensis]|uniref:Uncharacterized protein n=1 Tax=Pseudomonas frederiksbergensis TaxID=104087 RepID=A0A6L5C5G0_9PSED|nr:hypothetical protein FX983_02726 [Pseudomonas frederiksbergensis]